MDSGSTITKSSFLPTTATKKHSKRIVILRGRETSVSRIGAVRLLVQTPIKRLVIAFYIIEVFDKAFVIQCVWH